MPPTLIRDVRIFDGISVIHEAGSVLIDLDKIVSITENVPQDISENTEVIFGNGKTLLPGLIDCHVHAGSDPADLKQPLKFGVTTVLDMHNEPKAVAELSKASESSSNMSDFRSACHAATVQGGWPAPIYEMQQRGEEGDRHNHNQHTWSHIATEKDVDAFVKQNIANGCSYIKLMHESGTNFSAAFPIPDLSLQSAVVQAAHSHNLLAVGHATSIADALTLLHAGVDGLMHIPHDVPPTPELIRSFVSACARSSGESKSGGNGTGTGTGNGNGNSKVFITPTLAAYTSGTGTNASTLALLADPRVQHKLDAKSKAQLPHTLAFKGYKGTMANAYAWTRALKDCPGVEIVLGTDASPFVPGVAMGPSVLHELGLYVSECGFSAVEALRAATGRAAEAFGLRDRGRVAVGRRADLLLVEGDVCGDVMGLVELQGVWRGGVRLGGAKEGGFNS